MTACLPRTRASPRATTPCSPSAAGNRDDARSRGRLRNFVTRDIGPYSLGPRDADVACYGDMGAVTWVNGGHLWLAARLRLFRPVPNVRCTIDLGTGDFRSPPRITGDYAGFTVAWLTTGLAIQHFDYDTAGGVTFTLTPKPALPDGRQGRQRPIDRWSGSERRRGLPARRPDADPHQRRPGELVRTAHRRPRAVLQLHRRRAATHSLGSPGRTSLSR